MYVPGILTVAGKSASALVCAGEDILFVLISYLSESEANLSNLSVFPNIRGALLSLRINAMSVCRILTSSEPCMIKIWLREGFQRNPQKSLAFCQTSFTKKVRDMVRQ